VSKYLKKKKSILLCVLHGSCRTVEGVCAYLRFLIVRSVADLEAKFRVANVATSLILDCIIMKLTKCMYRVHVSILAIDLLRISKMLTRT